MVFVFQYGSNVYSSIKLFGNFIFKFICFWSPHLLPLFAISAFGNVTNLRSRNM